MMASCGKLSICLYKPVNFEIANRDELKVGYLAKCYKTRFGDIDLEKT
jgi:hypothetical protein